MTNRLLASGCSFTEYCWSTWADILGLSFVDYKNVGCAGADNAYIARSIVSNAQKGDTVVVMWTGFDRWSMYFPEQTFPARGNPDNHYRHQGPGALVRDKVFFTKYYQPVERFQTTIDYVQLVDLHSQVHGYTAYHFPAFPWLLAETAKEIDPEIQKINESLKIKNNYLNEISLFDLRIQNKQEFITGHKYTPSGDLHPTPMTHLDYVKEIIAPNLGIDLTSVDYSSIVAEQRDVLNGIVK